MLKSIKNKKIKGKVPKNVEYNSPSDAPIIKKKLKNSILVQKIKLAILAICFVFYEYLTYFFPKNSKIFSFEISTFDYIIFNAIIFSISFLCNIDSFISLLKKGCSFSVPILVTFILYMCSFYKVINSFLLKVTSNLFLGPLLAFSILNLLTSLLVNKRILRNLKFVNSKNKKYEVKICEKPTILSSEKKVYAELVEIENVRTFIKNSQKKTHVAKYINIIDIFVIIVAILLSAKSFFYHKNLWQTIDEFCAILTFCVPMTLLTVLNFCLNCYSKNALKNGVFLSNFNSVGEANCANSIILNDFNLYPAKQIALREIKTFNGQRVDEAILYAAAVTSHFGGTLSKVFDKVIMGQRKILPNVSDVIFEENFGVSGFANGKKIIIGNRNILKINKIFPPSKDYEKKYTKNKNVIVYIAVEQKLVAMFVLEYTPNKRFIKDLQNSIKNGIKILVKTSDTNITKKRIAFDFNVPYNLVELEVFNNNVTENSEKAYKDGKDGIVTIGDKMTMLRALNLCKNAKLKFNIIFVLQVMSCLLAITVCALLSFSNSIDLIGEFEVLLYNIFWLISSFFCLKFV